MIGARVATGLWLASARGHHRALSRALRDPGRAQERLLRRILRDNERSRYGRQHRFEAIDSVAAFRRRVPIVTFDELADDVDAIRRGVPGVLTAEPVTRLCPSGGTTRPKRVPYTRALSAALARGVGAWVVDLASRHPGLRGGPGYWSVSPAIAAPPEPDTRVPVGFDDDAAYLGRALEPLLRRALVGAPELRRARPLSSFRYATLRALLAEADLRLISVWHPSFLGLLLDALPTHWDRLLEDLARGRLSPPDGLPGPVARALTRGLRPDPARARVLAALGPGAPPSVLWPKLAVVSAWGDAAAAAPLRALGRRLGVPVQRKGLLATEAIVTLPFGGAHPVALTSTFVELVGEDGRAIGVHEARRGASYEVLVTTPGGLYRYRLGDRVVVDGQLGATPSLRLVGRADAVVDLVGEKLGEARAIAAIDRAFDGAPPAFAMLAPHGGGYVLYVDRAPDDPARAVAQLRAALREEPGYRYAIELGQLAPARIARCAPDAAARFLDRREARGQRLGDIKPAALADDDDWMRRLDGCLVAPADARAFLGMTR